MDLFFTLYSHVRYRILDLINNPFIYHQVKLKSFHKQQTLYNIPIPNVIIIQKLILDCIIAY